MSARRRVLLRNIALFAALLLPIVVLFTPTYSAAAVTTVAVTTTADSVDGDVGSLMLLDASPGPDNAISLREALLAAEATPAGDPIRITFNLSTNDHGYDLASGTWRILLNYAPSALLPALDRGNLEVDATTQLSVGGLPAVIIDGFEVVEGAGQSNGFVIHSANNIIKGLALINFYDSAVVLTGNQAIENTIAACSIGRSLRGSVDLPGYIGVEIRDGASGNVIGGLNPKDGNLIASNVNAGVLLNGTDTRENRVLKNTIGSDLNRVFGSNQRGVALIDGAHDNQIQTNTISGNTFGIYLRAATDNQIGGNQIGVLSDGQTANPNTEGGIYLVGGAAGNQIGGVAAGGRNIISANDGPGVYIANTGSDNNQVLGNYIGLAADGITPRGNLRQGVLIAVSAAHNQIGGSNADDANVIVYNGMGGVRIDSNQNIVRGNMIGIAANLTTPLGNQLHGIRLNGNQNQVIANTIAYNQGAGVVLTGLENSLAQNRIRNNAIAGACVNGDESVLTNNVISSNGMAGGTAGECLISGGIIITGNQANVNNNAILNNGGSGVIVQQGDRNTLSSNSISGNGDGILLREGGNIAIEPPNITTVAQFAVSGMACPACIVEVFVDSGSQGRDLLGHIVADANGKFMLSLATALPAGNVSATLTDANGNTSPFDVVPGLPSRAISYQISLPLVKTP